MLTAPFGKLRLPQDTYPGGLVLVSKSGRQTTWEVRRDYAETRDRGEQPPAPNGFRAPRVGTERTRRTAHLGAEVLLVAAREPARHRLVLVRVALHSGF